MAQRSSSRVTSHSYNKIRAAIESLELRQMLCADHAFIEANFKDLPDYIRTGINLTSTPVADEVDNELAPAPFTANGPVALGAFAVSTSSSASANLVVQKAAPGQSNGTGNWGGGLYGSASTAGNFSLRADGLPILNSLTGAAFSVFLDFDGWTGSGFGGQQTHTPYDTDGNAATFSATEQAAIAEGWRRMATFLAPFDINVTTVQPTSTKKDWSWSVIANSGGGYSWGQLGGTAPSAFNGSGELLSRFSGVLHELGHNFGLGHQGTYDDAGTLLREYRYRIDNIHGVIMGVDFDGYPSKWIAGHRGYKGNDPINVQDDLSIITGKIKPFEAAGGDGFRADDFGNTTATATALTVGGASKFGVIERLTDSDYFKFTSTGGTYKVTLTPDSPSSLDGALDIYNSSGQLLASGDGLTVIDSSVTLTLPSGTYYAVARGHSNYGDIGTYAINVATATPGTTPTYNNLPAPTGLAVNRGTGTDLSLTWNAVAGATGYTIERSLDGATYTTLTTTTGLTYTNTGLTGSARYFYRISANNASGKSLPSTAISQVNRPSAVTGFRVMTFDATHKVLDWVETTGETGYIIERSSNGSAFTQIATTAANSVSYTDSSVASGATYYYRVTPTSAFGNGPTTAVTPTPPTSAPIANPDTATTNGKSPVTINVLANDVDPNSDPIAIQSFTQPTRGTVVKNANNTFTYTSSLENAGTDTFTYTINDGKGNTAIGTVTITIQGVVARWKFDENAGTNAADSSGNGANGTLVSATWTGGKSGSAVLFDGTASGITFGNGPSLSGLTDFTVATWVKTSATAAGIILQQRDDPNYNGEYMLGTNATGNVTFMLYGDGGYQFDFSSSGAVNDGNWHFVSATRAGDVGSIYIDGVLSGTATGTARNLLAAAKVFAGYDGRDNNRYFNGALDEMSLYNRALSASEIAALVGSNQPPTVATAAAASSTSVTGTTVNLSVLGADADSAELALTYNWTITGPAGVAFSANGTNAAKNTTATFSAAGVYTFTATITDAQGATATSSVNVTVVATAKSIAITPPSISIATGATTTFTATVKDQFNAALPGTIAWSKVSGVGSINTAGLYTAPTTAGSAVIKATAGAISSTANVTVTSSVAKPTPPTNVTATQVAGTRQVKITWKDASNNETLFYIQVSTDGTNFKNIGTAAALTGTGSTGTYTTAAQNPGVLYFRVVSYNTAGHGYAVKTKISVI